MNLVTTLSSSEVHLVESLDLDALPLGQIYRLRLNMGEDGLGRPVRVPVMVCRGEKPGPVFGITAALHGNELNGIPIIHRLFSGLDPQKLRGSVVAVPVLNIPGLLGHRRAFTEGKDLNRTFPGRANGDDADRWADGILQKIIGHVEVLMDLHTASRGRVNSLYVRANMLDETTARMALLQRPQIIVHNPAPDATLRGQAMEMGIPSITVEVGNPSRFQRDMVRSGLNGIRNVMRHFKMLPGRVPVPGPQPVVCSSSYWLYTDRGGLLTVRPDLATYVEEGAIIARQTNAFGDVTIEYRAPETGVVIGKSVEPVAATGARILHLGIPADGPLLEVTP